MIYLYHFNFSKPTALIFLIHKRLELMPANMFSRKLLVSSPSSIWQHSDLQLTAQPPLPNSITHMNINLDKNILFITSIIMCGVILSFIMNFIIKYALKCLSSTASQAIPSPSAPSASQGIKQEALEAFPVVAYSAEAKLPGQDTECVICLSEFVSGDKVRVLPKCSHGFHLVCIDQWLGSHSTCPKCRHCLINICEKIVEGSGQAAGSPEPFLPAQGSPPSCILPVEHETMVRIYRSSS